MKFITSEVTHPKLALVVYLGVGVFLYKYGVRDGSLLMLDILIGVVVYKIFAR